MSEYYNGGGSNGSRRTNEREPAHVVYGEREKTRPYQVYSEIHNVGKTVESSKKRARWRWCFGEDGDENEVILIHSVVSGKKKVFLNGAVVHESQKVGKEWSHVWTMGAHLCRIDIDFEDYNFIIDAVPFRRFPKRDPYLAAQLQAVKRESLRTITQPTPSKEGLSPSPERTTGGADRNRRSSADRAGRRQSTDKASPEPAAGVAKPATRVRRPSGGDAVGEKKEEAAANGPKKSGPKKTRSAANVSPPPAETAPVPDILSADTAVLQPPGVGSSDPFGQGFDPLANRYAMQGHAVADGAAVLQLGMQFEAMGVDYSQQYMQMQQQQQMLMMQQQQAMMDAGQLQMPVGSMVPYGHPQPDGHFQAGPNNGAREERQSTGDKDLWQVAIEKDFINMDDITATKKKSEVLKEQQYTLDKRSLKELEAIQPPKEKQPVMLQRPEPQVMYQGGVPGAVPMAIVPMGYGFATVAQPAAMGMASVYPGQAGMGYPTQMQTGYPAQAFGTAQPMGMQQGMPQQMQYATGMYPPAPSQNAPAAGAFYTVQR